MSTPVSTSTLPVRLLALLFTAPLCAGLLASPAHAQVSGGLEGRVIQVEAPERDPIIRRGCDAGASGPLSPGAGAALLGGLALARRRRRRG